jgi:asparagine synthase (glutamine-hydrolysing)
MPGFHTLIQMQDNVLDAQSTERKFKTVLKKMRHYPRYVTKSIINSETVKMGFSGYSGYPFKIYKSGNRTIIIEGKIYNRDDKEIIDLLSTIPLEQGYLTRELKRFLLNSDGEFVVHVYDKERDFYFLFNDGLGRLSLYYYSSSNSIIVSKEINFIIPFLNKVIFSRAALAEYLLFRYPLGKRTLIENIYRLLPATLLLIDIRNQSFSNKVLLKWNLDSEQMKPNELNKATNKLLTIFLSSLRNRVNSFPNYVPLVSLSGGYDSRTVLAGLSKLKTNPIARTYVNKQSRPEVPIAREISHVLNVKHETISVPSPVEVKLEDMYWLAYLKDGLNDVAFCHLLKFYGKITGDLGNEIIGYTGDGGDMTLAPFIPFNPEAKRFSRRTNSSKQLSTLITLTETHFSFKEISLILDVDEKTLKEHIEVHLSSYPEQTLEGKYKHFKIFEKAFKWLGEGESRNRFFFWHTTPFYSLPFFVEVMKMPQAAKKNMKYYKHFLSKLNPACANVYYPMPPRKRIINGLMQMSMTKLDIFFCSYG